VTRNQLLISAAGLAAELGQAGLRLVDCRFELLDPAAGRLRYLANHIPGAVHADLDRDLAGPRRSDSGRHPLPDSAAFATTLGRLGIDRATPVVVYDEGPGAVAARAWWMLRWLGHGDVRLLDGGYAEWCRHGLPVEAGPVSVAPRSYAGEPHDERVVDTSAIQAAGGATSLRLVDARDRQRFAGIAEPIDAVAGHIPGAINVPYLQSIDEQGLWKSREALARLWSSALAGAAEQDCCVMCGSGVTACHLAVSALLAGRREPRLYVGSWSEWITDPARPVARDA
jgi:thiosulfate/3-mercaptopyruvate sulfurtransferase